MIVFVRMSKNRVIKKSERKVKNFFSISRKEGEDMLTAYFSIKGIRCASCVASIERSLSTIGGIESINVSLVSSKAQVVYDETRVNTGSIAQYIKELGYEADYIPTNEIMHIKRGEQAETEYIQGLLKKLIVSIVLTIPLVVVAMSTMHKEYSFSTIVILSSIQLVLVLPIMLLGLQRFIGGLRSLSRGKPTMDSLITLGVGTAFIYSLYQVGYIFLGNGEHYSKLYFESAGSILTFVFLGEYLEKRAKHKASQTLLALVSLVPSTAIKVYSDGGTRTISITSIECGDIVLVQQGMSIPIDGTVIQGEGTINESMLTGESLPSYKTIDDSVFAGTIVMEGTYRIRVDVAPSESQLNKLILAVEKAQQTKAPIAKLADIVSQYFVPVVLVISIVAGITWFIITGSASYSIGIAITTLIIACPCAMGLATPLSLIIGMSRATKHGIVIKNGRALEQVAKITTIFFDKTGTITSGVPRVYTVYPHKEYTQEMIMEYIVPIVHYSTHPITRALEMYTKEVKSKYRVATFQNTVGKGISAVLEDSEVGNALYNPEVSIQIGSERFMKELGVYPKEEGEQKQIQEECSRLYGEGASPLYISDSKDVIAVIGLKDTVRPDAKEAIGLLQKAGIRCVMLSGDVVESAKAIAEEVGIENVYGGLLPEEKSSIIEDYKAKGVVSMMIGDGINDAVALSVADVGVAMGQGVDIAQEASSIVLLQENLKNIYTLYILSKATIRNIKQNLFWAFFYNALSIPVATGVLYGVSGILVTPMIASVAMVCSSLSVVGNALRLQYKKL